MKFPEIRLNMSRFDPYWKNLSSKGQLANFALIIQRAKTNSLFAQQMKKRYNDRLNYYRGLLFRDPEKFSNEPEELEKFYIFLWIQKTLDSEQSQIWLNKITTKTEDLLKQTEYLRFTRYPT